MTEDHIHSVPFEAEGGWPYRHHRADLIHRDGDGRFPALGQGQVIHHLTSSRGGVDDDTGMLGWRSLVINESN